MNNAKKVEFDGHCAFAVSVGKKDVPSKSKYFIIDNEKKFHFSNPVAKFLWKVLPSRKQKAESNWLSR
ncbi:hypothetical protein ACQCT3_20755 [Sutcliffiella horikoshii]|uniref:hypothetical protein n=1 Tax=Sutcliffiella horikoshii TaxID=79883 RepID=UPI003CE8EEE6